MSLPNNVEKLFDGKFKPLLKRLNSFFRHKKGKGSSQLKEVWISLGGVLVVVGIIGLVVLATVNKVAPEETPVVIEQLAPEVALVLRHPLTGKVLETELDTLPQVFGTMVENSADAWPLSGLDEAFFVIEAPVEANIPRFIVFSSVEDDIAKIGPVRSARPYYLDWNDALDAVYGHVGGSFEALDLIKFTYNTIDLNQFFHGNSYYRQLTNGRYAPHNVFTSTKMLKDALPGLNLDAPKYEFWKFKDDTGATGNKSVKVDFADGATYDVVWNFDQSGNTYVRDQGSRKMVLENGNQIEANNVAVIATDIKIFDAEGRKHMVTVGSGDAMLLQDGEVKLVRWVKETRTGRLYFTDTNNEEIRMNPGKTWIEVVSSVSQARVID